MEQKAKCRKCFTWQLPQQLHKFNNHANPRGFTTTRTSCDLMDHILQDITLAISWFFFSIKNPTNLVANPYQSQRTFPRQIHKEFFGYLLFLRVPNSLGISNFLRFFLLSPIIPLAHNFDAGCYRPAIKSLVVSHHLHQTHMSFHTILLHSSQIPTLVCNTKVLKSLHSFKTTPSTTKC